MKVIDASVLVPALIDEGASGAGARLLSSVDAPFAPELLDLEVASAVRRSVRHGGIGVERGELALRELAELPIVRSPHLPLLGRIWELRDNLTPYDASYVALAELMGCGLLTADRRLASAPGIRCEVELAT